MAKAQPTQTKAPAQPALPAAPAGSPAVIALLQHLTARLGGLITDRTSFWTHWQELAKYLIPRRYKWLITPNQANRGSPINQAIIDNTATISLRRCSSGMMAGITSPGRPWFKFTVDDLQLREVPEVKLWLDEVTKRMLTVFAESNFYQALATMYVDLGAFGTHAMVMREDFDDVLRCYNFCLGEYSLANDARMEANTCYRQFVMTVPQVVSEFGLENCSETVKQAWETKGSSLSREIVVCHAIEPNDGLSDPFPAMRQFAFREVYWEQGQGYNKLLRLTGFHERALIAPRWDIVGNDAYGRSPGMDALGDIKQLQVEQKRKAQAIDKGVNPPMVADISLKNEPASLLPGGVTYVQSTSQTGFKPAYEMRLDLGDLKEDIGECQARIRVAFFEDLFLMLSSMDGVQPRNDLEILKREEEKLIQLGPVLERFQNEALDPAIDRAFNIMRRAGLLPPPPRELAGAFIKPEYTSILAVAQKAAMTAGIERLVSFVGRAAAGQAGIQGIGPEALDTIDWDEAIDQYADMLGVPEKILRPAAQVLKMRQARAKQQQAAAGMEMAGAAVEGAKTLSETDVGGGMNALQMMAA